MHSASLPICASSKTDSPSQNKLTSGFLFALTFLLGTCLNGRALGQGSAADYQRAAEFAGKFRDQVYRSRVRPKWLSSGQAFWYRVQTGENTHQFILVDADRGTRRVAFDHDQLATALHEQTEQDVDSQDLPFDALWFDDKQHIFFEAFNKPWRFNPESGELITDENLEIPNESLAIQLNEPKASRDRGEQTHVVFRNRTEQAVDVIWINREGGEQHYHTLQPGQRIQQHTYIGHVWVAKADTKVMGIYEATDGALIVIDGKPPKQKAAQENEEKAKDQPAKKPNLRSSTSPDGKWDISIRVNNVFIRNTETDESTLLSESDPTDDRFRERYLWSPDSSRLVVMQEKPGEGHDIHYVESSPRGQVQPKLHSMHYYKPGDKIPVPRPRLFNIETLEQVDVPDTLFQNAWSISELRWADDSSRFTFLYNQRGHQVLRIVGVTRDGDASAVVDEQSKTFIDYNGKVFSEYLDATDEIVWMSERDGWNHLYLFDSLTGKIKNQITKGEWVVRGVDRIDIDKRQIWFRAGGIRPEQDPYYIHYCRVNFDGTGLTVLTAGDGTHRITYSPNRKFFIDTYSRVNLPPVSELRRTDDGSLVCELERATLPDDWPVPEPFKAKGRDGKTDIYGVIYRPSNFDPDQTYPIVEDIYAGPHSAHVSKRFNTSVGAQKMAELGFIVVRIDGMGTNHRSKAFHDVCWQNLMDGGFPDRIAWIQTAAAKYPQMDLTRVGIYGGSAGGQNALAALLNHGDFYHAAVSDCGCHDNRMDKIWWNEQWMGWPVGPHYAENSNVTHAHKLQGKLMLMLGEMDRNVDPASTMQVVDALVKADKDFDLVIIPGGGHIAESNPYGFRRRQDFFVRHLLGVEPRHGEDGVSSEN